MGLPCRHIIALFGPPEVENVSIRWLRDYIAKYKRPGFAGTTNEFRKAMGRSRPGCELTARQIASLQDMLPTAGSYTPGTIDDPTHFFFSTGSVEAEEDKENEDPSNSTIEFGHNMSGEAFLTAEAKASAKPDHSDNPYVLNLPIYKEITTLLVNYRREIKERFTSTLENFLAELHQAPGEGQGRSLSLPNFLRDQRQRTVSSQFLHQDKRQKASRFLAAHER
jgi:hypothetical protein